MTATMLALLLPSVVGLVLVAMGRRADVIAAPFAAVIAAATLVVVLLSEGAERSYPFLLGQPWRLASDGLSHALAVTVCAVTVCVLLAVPTQVQQRRGRLSGYLLLFLAAVLLTLAARDLLSLLVGWELMGAASYVLIGHELRSARAAGSATTALLTTRAMDLGLYAAAGAALAGAGTLQLSALPGLTGWPLHLAALGVLAAALGKAAQLPVSFWLSRAMDGPSPVSALLHSAAMVAMGGYLLVRVSPLLAASGWADDAAAWTGGLTAVLLGVVAVAQTDLKQLLAASTASQLGLVVLAAGIGATSAGGAHLVAHAAVKSLLFLAAGIWLHALNTRELAGLRAAAVRTPVVGVLAVLGLLALAGLPPFALWGSKDAVLAAAAEHGAGLYAVGLLATALSAAYAGRALVVLVAAPEGRAPVSVRGTSWAPLVPLAAGASVLALLVIGGTGDRFARLIGDPLPAVEARWLALSGVVSAAVLALMWWRGERLSSALPSWVRGWYGLETAARAVAVRPVLALSQALAAFDDRILDRAVMTAPRAVRRVSVGLALFDDRRLDTAVDATATGAVRLARGAGALDERSVDGAVEAVARTARRLGTQARRPQTGQVHDYYGQAAVLLVAATALLLLVR